MSSWIIIQGKEIDESTSSKLAIVYCWARKTGFG